MKILGKIACLLALAALLCPVHAPAEQEALRYYYLNPCEHCSPEADFDKTIEREKAHSHEWGGRTVGGCS